MATKHLLKTAVLACMMIIGAAKGASAQDVKEADVKYHKQTHPGVIATYNEDEDVVRAVLLKRLSAAGLNVKKAHKGFYEYNGVNWNDILPEKVDVYMRVDGNKNNANAYIMISKGYDNFISTATDPDAIEKLKNILGSLGPDIEEYKKAQALAAQQEAVADAEADARKAQRKADRAAKRNAREQEKLKKQQEKLSEIQK